MIMNNEMHLNNGNLAYDGFFRYSDALLYVPSSITLLPSLRLRPLKGFFELTQCPSRALDSLLLELHRNKNTVRCAAPGAEVQGDHQKQLTQTLIVRLLKRHFLIDCEKLTE